MSELGTKAEREGGVVGCDRCRKLRFTASSKEKMSAASFLFFFEGSLGCWQRELSNMQVGNGRLVVGGRIKWMPRLEEFRLLCWRFPLSAWGRGRCQNAR